MAATLLFPPHVSSSPGRLAVVSDIRHWTSEEYTRVVIDIEAEASFDDSALALPAILRAVAEGKSFVTLDDGGAALLPPEWTARLQAIGTLSNPVEGSDAMRIARA